MSSLQPQSIQQLRRDVEQLQQELDKLRIKVKQTNRVTQRGINLLTAAMALTRRMTGDENLDNAIAKMQRTISTILLMVRTYQMAMAQLGPIGMLLAGISAVSTAYTLTDVVGSYG